MSKKLKQKNRTKFNVDKDIKKRTYDGIIFDSVLEMKYYKDVVLPQMRSGYIVNCELQKPYELQPKFKHGNKTVQPIKYIADFVIEYENGKQLVVDIKGYADSVAKMKRKMFWYLYPDTQYQWITYAKKYGGWILYDDYNSFRKEAKRVQMGIHK